jgi:hypothetical protein
MSWTRGCRKEEKDAPQLKMPSGGWIWGAMRMDSDYKMYVFDYKGKYILTRHYIYPEMRFSQHGQCQQKYVHVTACK